MVGICIMPVPFSMLIKDLDIRVIRIASRFIKGSIYETQVLRIIL